MPTNIQGNRLLQHSMLLLISTQIGNLANILFQMLMMRQLRDAPEEYGALAAMLGLVTIISTPMEALRTTAAHCAASLRQRQQCAAALIMVKHWMRKLILPAMIPLTLGVICVGPLQAFFQMPSPAIITITALVMTLTIFLPVPTGALQGIESFGWMSAVAPAWGLGRLLAALILTVWIAANAAAGLAAQAFGIILAISIAGLGLYCKLGKMTSGLKTDLPAARGYMVGAFATLLGFAVMMNADIVMVKHLFPPETAGLFARAATLARLVIFLPAPIALAMFPKVVAGGPVSAEHRHTFRLALLCTTGLIIGAAAACTILAGLLWRIFTGTTGTPEELTLLRQLVWAMSPLGIVFLILNFEMARRRFRCAVIMAGFALTYITAVMILHQTLTHVIIILAIINASALAALISLTHTKREGCADFFTTEPDKRKECRRGCRKNAQEEKDKKEN